MDATYFVIPRKVLDNLPMITDMIETAKKVLLNANPGAISDISIEIHDQDDDDTVTVVLRLDKSILESIIYN